MGYSSEVVRRARQRLESARADRESQTRIRLQEVYGKLPRVKEIDMQLRRTMALAAQTVFSQGTDAEQAFEEVKQANLILQQERQALIDRQFGPGYLDESPLCPHCGGTGYIGTAMCSCLKELCRQEQEKELTLLAAPDQRFDAFRLDYYPSQVEPKFGFSPRAVMERTFNDCKIMPIPFLLKAAICCSSAAPVWEKPFSPPVLPVPQRQRATPWPMRRPRICLPKWKRTVLTRMKKATTP